MVGGGPAGDGLGRRWIYQKRGRVREVEVRRDGTPEDPVTPVWKAGVKEQDMRAPKLPAWLAAETRVRSEGRPEGRAYDHGGGEQGGHRRAIMRLGLSN